MYALSGSSPVLESESPHPDEVAELAAEVVARFARIGGTCTVADERGLCTELRVKVVAGDSLVVSTPADRLRPGMRVTGRGHDGAEVRQLMFSVEEVEDTLPGRADALLRLQETMARGDERHDHRFEFDAPGTAATHDPFGGADGRPAAIRIADVSRSGIAFIADRRFEPGEPVDIAFEDEAGAAIRARAQVLRAERAVYGRTRYAARILAIGEMDQLRLDRLCNRCRLRDEAAQSAADDDMPLLEMLAASSQGRGGLRRLFGRA
jgi:hypothetical protein